MTDNRLSPGNGELWRTLAELLIARWDQSGLISSRGRSILISSDDLRHITHALRSRVPAQGATAQATEEQIFDCLYANIYADNDGVAGLSSFVEELLEKFDVRSKASPPPSTGLCTPEGDSK